MKKKLLIFLIFFILGALLMYNFIYKKHRNIADEKESYVLSVDNLKSDFSQNDSLSNAKYLDKTIVIYGKISSIDLITNCIYIDGSVSAILKEKPMGLKVNDSIQLKGRFIGYDDLLEEFKMDECTPVRL
ncbi:OB-fold protein [Flavobacterium sp.]|uniref:OB-fold protein n=1 Tax=Flavobacterium sp. TaxID=239 RepID=UPI002FDE4C7A